MADKDFRVKNKLHVNGLSQTSGVILATNNALDAHTNVPTQYGGTGTTTSPNAGQVLYSASGTTYAPTDLSSLITSGSNYIQTSMPSTPSTGSFWVDTDASPVSVSQYLAPTIGSTAITSNTTISTINGLTLNSPTLSGTPLSVTASAGTNTTQIATTAFVQTAVSSKVGNSKSIAMSIVFGW